MKILSGNMMEHLIAIVVSAMAFAVMAATPCPVVVIPDMPTEVEKFAAAELAGELGRCLGEVPEIVYKGVWKHELTKETSELLGFKAALSTDANRAALVALGLDKIADTYYGELNHYGMHWLRWADVRRRRY